MPSPFPFPRPGADPDAQRIAKLLARAGVASRREVERMIAEGRVAVDGVAIDTPATILPSLAGVTVDGHPVEAPAAARLFLYHKPAGLLVTERDPAGRATIYDRLPKGLPRVVPVGRLDLGTEGLLLLTTDGGLKRQLELPATGVERVYRARAYGPVTQAMLEDLITGIEIEGIRYGPIDANLERRTGANVWIEMKLTEGKNREVRRVLDHLGLSVSRLIRTRYGPFALGDLMPGAIVEVRAHDIESFRKNPTRVDLPQPARQRGSQPAPVAMPPTAERPRQPAATDAGNRAPRGGSSDRVLGSDRPRRPTSADRVAAAPVGKPMRAAHGRTSHDAAEVSGGRASMSATRRHGPHPAAPRKGHSAAPQPGSGDRLSGRGRDEKAERPRSADPGGERRRGRGADQRRDDAPIDKPARAARARAFRDASAPAVGAGPRRPTTQSRSGADPLPKDGGKRTTGASRKPTRSRAPLASGRDGRPPRRPTR